MGPTGESDFQLFTLCFLCHHRASLCSLAYMRIWKLMEVLLKMLTVAHSNQCVGIRSEECGGQRKDGDSVVEEREHTHSSFAGVGGGAGGWRCSAQRSEERESVHSVSLCSYLAPPYQAMLGTWWEAPAETSFSAWPLGCLPAYSA